jgi:hypothetical protein
MSRWRSTAGGPSPFGPAWLRAVGDFLGWVFRREELPRASRATRSDEPGFLSWLFRRERLPHPRPGSPEASEHFATWLFGRDRLPDPGRRRDPGGSP